MVTDSLPVGWQWATLSDIAANGYGLVDGPFGSSLPASEYVDMGVPVIRGSNLTFGDGFFKSDEFVYVSEKTAKRLSRSLCFPEDIVFTKKGTLGQTGFVPRDPRFEKYLLSSNQMKLRVDRTVADPLFVYYYVSSPQSREKIIRDSEATGVPKTNLEYLRAFPIPLPPLSEQRAIAHILGTLDDKIELNRRMNATLEVMARTIFQSWFVDFDPVHAKAAGQQPYGMDAETAALFPNAFEESELGLIPASWRIFELGDVIELAYGKALTAEKRGRGTVPVYGSNGQVGWHDEALVTGPGIVVGRKGNPGTVVWAPVDFFPIDTTFFVVPTGPVTDLHYLFFALDYQGLPALAADSAVPGLNRNLALMNSILVPPPELIECFAAYAEPVFRLVHTNSEQSHTLAALRDTLLPKLISGGIAGGGRGRAPGGKKWLGMMD